MAPRSLPAEWKLVLALFAFGALAGAAGAELVSRVFEERVEAVGATVLAGADEAFRAQQAAEVDKLGAALEGLMASRELRAAFAKRDGARLLRLAEPLLAGLRERHRITHWYFMEPGPPPRVFLRVHRPELKDDVVERITLRRAVETGEQGAGLELGRTAFALRVVRPWIVDGQVIGYMELAEEVTSFLSTMKGRTGDDYGLLVRKRLVDERAWATVLGPRVNSWNARPDVLLVDASDFTDGIADFDGDFDRLPETGRFLGEGERGGRTFVRGIFPVADAAGGRVAALYVVHDFTAHHRAVGGGRLRTYAIFLLLALGGAAGTVALTRRLVFGRLAGLRRRLELRVAGAAPRGSPGRISSDDDLGQLEALFDRALGDGPPPGAGPAAAPPATEPGHAASRGPHA